MALVSQERIERWLRKTYKGQWVIYIKCPYCLNNQVIKTVTFTCDYCQTRCDLRKLPYNLTNLIVAISGPTGKESEYEKIAYVRRLLYKTAKPMPWL